MRLSQFGSLNKSSLEQAASDPAHVNWQSFFSSVNPADVAESDVQSVGKLLKVLSYAGNSHEAVEQKALYSAIDEFFRKKFRKLTPEEALSILLPLGENTDNKLSVLDDKFWVWETLEEATRANVNSLKEEDLIRVMKAYGGNYKGSDELWDQLLLRTHYLGATPF